MYDNMTPGIAVALKTKLVTHHDGLNETIMTFTKKQWLMPNLLNKVMIGADTDPVDRIVQLLYTPLSH